MEAARRCDDGGDSFIREVLRLDFLELFIDMGISFCIEIKYEKIIGADADVEIERITSDGFAPNLVNLGRVRCLLAKANRPNWLLAIGFARKDTKALFGQGDGMIPFIQSSPGIEKAPKLM